MRYRIYKDIRTFLPDEATDEEDERGERVNPVLLLYNSGVDLNPVEIRVNSIWNDGHLPFRNIIEPHSLDHRHF